MQRSPESYRRILLVLVNLQVFCGCLAAPKVTFKSDLDASLTMVTYDNPQATGKKVGNTPITLPVSSLRNGPLRIQSPGLPDQYWIFQDVKDGALEINLKLETSKTSIPNSCSVDVMNQQGRMILMAYEALTRADFKTTLQLADQLITLAPGVAAPHILSGIAYMQSKQNDRATAAFTRARALDPSDKNIERLLQAVKR